MKKWCTSQQRVWKKLKGKTNKDGENYYINKHLPEQYIEQECVIREQIKEQKMKEQHLPKEQKSQIKVIKGVVHVNNPI